MTLPWPVLRWAVMIGIHDPYISAEEEAAVLEALRSNWISGGGSKVAAFEEELRHFLGLSHAPLATVNGSSALVLALSALGVKKGEHVLVSAYGFVATANCVRLLGAEPIFIGPEHGEFPVVTHRQVEKFLAEHVSADGCFKATGGKIRGMLYNEPFGFVCPALRETVSAFEARGMFLVEDASQAIGVRMGNSYLGTLGTMGVFSFNGNKTITTGAGGLLMAKDKTLLTRARKLQHQARSDSFDFVYDEPGHNFLMSNVLGAIGLAQAQRLPYILEKKSALRKAYGAAIAGTSLRLAGGADFPAWLNVLVFPHKTRDREVFRELAAQLGKEGIQIRPAFPSVTSYPMYRGSPLIDGTLTDELFDRAVCLPSGARVSESQARHIIASLQEKAKKLSLC